MKLEDVEIGMIVRLNGTNEKLTVVGFEKKIAMQKNGTEASVIAIKCIVQKTESEIFYPPETLTLIQANEELDKTEDEVKKIIPQVAWPFPT
jgi:hypothetical protein